VNRARSSLALTLVALAACAGGVQASAATTSPKLVAPANGAILRLGVRPTFVVRDGQDLIATLEVSKSPRTDVNGVFADSVWTMGYDSRPKGKNITVSPERSSSPSRFWNKPGTYYWHVDRLDCSYLGPRPRTCTHLVTRTRSFRIRRPRAT
jgi:hypothetical protein